MPFKTADICDQHAEVQVADPVFRAFGRKVAFCGPAHTLRVFEDNSLVRAALETPGGGRVLVVDGGGSLRCALVGDRLAALAVENDWAGIVVHGAIRDSADIDGMALGVRALAANPRKSVKRGDGEAGLTVTFAGVRIAEGAWVYVDADGVLVSDHRLDGGA
ncbi:MAG: ribonuclease E activity regulator RraA [Deltaproteobacteria bacterium]|nr:ribonuclease E activity regulator RraA [Deltaproteobacteria bacterium]